LIITNTPGNAGWGYDRDVSTQEHDAGTGAKLTRRAAIGLGGGAMLALAGNGTALALVGPIAASGSRVWRRSTYRPLVGHAFAVAGSATTLALEAIDDLPHRPAGSEHAFALRFRQTAGGRSMPRTLPTLQHPALGRFEMFLVAGEERTGQTYRAVIDRTHG
jgi:hypothetical protein